MIKKFDILKDIPSNAFSKFFITKLNSEIIKLIQVSLDEDLDEIGDVTSNAIIDDKREGSAFIISKQDGVFAGGFVVKMVYYYINPSLDIQVNVKEGEVIENNQLVIKIKGSLKSILIGERTVLNFLARMSGIATLTNKFVKAAKGANIKILDTRKTLPGWRYLDKYCVFIGSGKNHRIGLFDMVLIKENHIVAAGNIKNAVTMCKNYLKEKGFNLTLEVETTNMEELNEALEAGVDRIMLDNMNIEQIKQAVALIDGKVELEISGGINLENFNQFYNSGVNYISIGQLTHSTKAFDYSLLIEKN